MIFDIQLRILLGGVHVHELPQKNINIITRDRYPQ